MTGLGRLDGRPGYAFSVFLGERSLLSLLTGGDRIRVVITAPDGTTVYDDDRSTSLLFDTIDLLDGQVLIDVG